MVDVTLGASFAHAQALDGVDKVRVSACNGDFTSIVWLHEAPEERETASKADPLRQVERFALDDLQYQPSGTTEPSEKALVALTLLAQRTTTPCFKLRRAGDGSLVSLDMPWASEENPSGSPRAKVVASGTKRTIQLYPGGETEFAVELHDPKDGGFWLEDIANVLLPLRFARDRNTVLMRNVVIPPVDEEDQLRKGIGRFLSQRPNRPEIRIRAGEVLSFDPWHRSMFDRTSLQPTLNRLWRKKKGAFQRKLMPELIAMGGVNEIDMILARGGDLIPVELKHKRPRLNDVQKLVAVARRTNKLRPTNLEAWLIHTFRPDDPKAWREEKGVWEAMYPGLRVMHVFDDLIPQLPVAKSNRGIKPGLWKQFPYGAWVAIRSHPPDVLDAHLDIQSILDDERIALREVVRYVMRHNADHLYQPLLGIDLLSDAEAIVVDLDSEGWKNFRTDGQGILAAAVDAWKSKTSYAGRAFRANFIDRP
ncbi:MAG: hypothetical protein VXY14_03250 [Candidatus Thermoplasmatota archaeon]|nr:hypothetical protein [Candidatus Thermoplasmatota archaeon]